MMNDEQKEALEALEGALAKCKVANVPDTMVQDTYRHSRDAKMSITLITDDGKLNPLWVNEVVAQSITTVEQAINAGITLMAQHATRVNLFLHDFRQNRDIYVDQLTVNQARYIPKPDRYHNPAETLFIRTGSYGRSRPTSLEFSSLDKSRSRVFGREPFKPSLRTQESDEELRKFFFGLNSYSLPSAEKLKEAGFSSDPGPLSAEELDDLIFHPQPKD